MWKQLWKRMLNINTELLVRVAARMVVINNVYWLTMGIFESPWIPHAFIMLALNYYIFRREKLRDEKQNI